MQKLSSNYQGVEIAVEAEGTKRLTQCVKRSCVVCVGEYGAASYVGVHVSADFVRLKLRYDKCEAAGGRHDTEDHALKSCQLKACEIPEIGAGNQEGTSEALLAECLLKDTDPRCVHDLTSCA